MDIKASDEKNKIHVGQSIRKARLYRGIKQRTLASALQIKQQTISRIEQQEEVEESVLRNTAIFLNLPVKAVKNFNDDELPAFSDNHFSGDCFEEVIKSFKIGLDKERQKMESLIRFYRKYGHIQASKSSIHWGRKVEAIRRLQNITQAELGRALGITKQAVSKMERTEKINANKLNQIVKALGISVTKLKEFKETTDFNYNLIIHHEPKRTLSKFNINALIETLQKILQEEIQEFEKLKGR